MAKQRIERFAGGPIHMSWGSIIGGTFVALGVWILLYAFGLAAGLSAVDPGDPGSARTAGIGTGIWSLIAPLIALFVGGIVAARTAGVIDRTGAALHGATLWGLTTVVGTVAMGVALGSLVGGLIGAGTKAVQQAGGAMEGAPAMAESLGIDTNDLVAPVNERLRAEGKPEITAEQLNAATKDVVGVAIREGKLNREVLVGSIAQNTALSRQDAEQVAASIETRISERKEQVGGQLQQGALAAASKTGKALWGVFAALALGLVSAILGALLGVSRTQRLYAAEPVEGVIAVERRPGEVTP